MRVALSVTALALALTACSGEPVDDPTVQAPPTRAASSVPVAPSPSATGAITLTGNGIDTPQALLEFGSASVADVRQALGEPTLDQGDGVPTGEYDTCPGEQIAALEYAGGGLRVLFNDVQGDLTMFSWALLEESDEVPPASAFVGDVTTYEFGVGETLAELRAGAQGAELEVVAPAAEEFDPAFRLTDQSPGFFGTLTGTADSDTVTSVTGGQSCGE